MLSLKATLFAQNERFNVKPAPFSSRIYDEFSPVFYKGGLVFCSNQSDNSVVSFNDGNIRLFKIFSVTKKGNAGWTAPKIMAKELTTGFNDGPVTFNEDGNIIYYTRNTSVENNLRNISDTTNKLGIYSAELINGIWTNIQPFDFNNPLYSYSTPSLTPDGQRLYFSSNMPGGNGGMDLYYCERANNKWNDPVNMGPVINTRGNESFPFACGYGRLYFSSDGHEGFGGKDLFYTQEINGQWIAPVHLDSAINSEADDFGLVTDSTLVNGYFSTNRRKTDDIYIFSSAPVEFTECDTVRENNFCFTFYDERYHLIDTIPVIYMWDFGEGIVKPGKEVKHCFPGPGNYSVKLSIYDEITGDTIANQVNYDVVLENIEQAYIKSSDVGFAGNQMSFEGQIADLKGISITDYFWDIGDGFKPGSPTLNATFTKKGEYTVRLGLLAEKNRKGVIKKICVLKRIRIS